MIRQSIPDDKALPQMPRLLDVETMAPVLEGMLEESTLAAVRISYLRYRPGRRLLVCYEVETAEGVHQAVAVAKVGVDLAAQASDTRNTELVRKARGRSPACTPLAYDPGLDALIQWSPVDIELPALPSYRRGYATSSCKPGSRSKTTSCRNSSSTSR